MQSSCKFGPLSRILGFTYFYRRFDNGADCLLLFPPSLPPGQGPDYVIHRIGFPLHLGGVPFHVAEFLTFWSQKNGKERRNYSHLATVPSFALIIRSCQLQSFTFDSSSQPDCVRMSLSKIISTEVAAIEIKIDKWPFLVGTMVACASMFDRYICAFYSYF